MARGDAQDVNTYAKAESRITEFRNPADRERRSPSFTDCSLAPGEPDWVIYDPSRSFKRVPIVECVCDVCTHVRGRTTR